MKRGLTASEAIAKLNKFGFYLKNAISGCECYSQIISKDYVDFAWPLNVDSVEICCVEADYAIVYINDIPFALNGLAATKFKLVHIQKTPHYIFGENISPLIQYCLQLDKRNLPGERKVLSLK